MNLLYDGKHVSRKIKNTVPHDLGDSEVEPYLQLNGYLIHDVSEWRDLNVKFVLQVFRDYKLLQNSGNCDAQQYLVDMYEACKTVMKFTLKFDRDNDGVIENAGMPDQTYNSWVMTGTSAYCGGLWIAALYAMMELAKAKYQKEEAEDFQFYKENFERGQKSFQKLSNG